MTTWVHCSMIDNLLTCFISFVNPPFLVDSTMATIGDPRVHTPTKSWDLEKFRPTLESMTRNLRENDEKMKEI